MYLFPAESESSCEAPGDLFTNYESEMGQI